MRTLVAIGVSIFASLALAMPTGAQDTATCSPWTDNPIVSGQTPIRAEHINELRACLDLVLDTLNQIPLVGGGGDDGGGGDGSGKQITVSNVAFDHDTGGYYYAVTGEISNTGSEAIDGWITWARFYGADGTLVVEEDERRPNELDAGERTQFRIQVDREDTRGWTYFLVSLVDDGVTLPCVGCSERHLPPAPGPCGVPFDEAIAVTRQCRSGNWWASGADTRSVDMLG